MIKNIQSLIINKLTLTATITRANPIFKGIVQQNPTQYFSNSNKFNKTAEDDDENISFADLLKQGEENVERQQRLKEKIEQRQEELESMMQFDARELAYKNIKAQERILKEEEIQRNTKETFTYTNKENPFFNSEAATIYRQLSSEEEILRDWQYNFKKQNKKHPSLKDMLADPTISRILDNRQKKQKMLHASVFKYRIN